MQRRSARSPLHSGLRSQQSPLLLLPCALLCLCSATAAFAAATSGPQHQHRRHLRGGEDRSSRRSLLQSGADCADIVGYRTVPDVDHVGDDLGAAFANLRYAVGNCTADPTCRGFNSANVLKRAVAPTVPSAGSCLYVKQSAECRDTANATLEAHNKYRALHGAPALVWSDKLASQAQVWAQWLAARDCVLEHYTGGSDGENLYAMFGSRLTPAAATCVPAVDAWYKEVARYRFTSTPYTDNRANFEAIGHFTQVVWKGTSQLGCGAARANSGRCYAVVCRYAAAGNVQGDRSYLDNVAPRKAP